MPGVRDVGVLTFVGGYYQDSVEFRSRSSAIDIDRSIRWQLRRSTTRTLEAMRGTRTGAIIGPELVEPLRLEDRRPVPCGRRSGPRQDGSNDWTFDIVGIYGIPEGAFPADGNFWINYDYFDEERAFAKGTVTFYTVR